LVKGGFSKNLEEKKDVGPVLGTNLKCKKRKQPQRKV